ncbi:MAG: GntR family transcriptional regulator [Treponema sp.]|jgi:DNA-binding GntR family transcriptional regulator|nr:GntR family transcriptional regulator [Treponema sp.]
MSDALVVLEHRTLTERVLEQLMTWVVDGTIRMGEKLNTKALAQKLNVSRMPIREAIKDLETMGLVESVPYVGARLVTLTEEDIREIYIMRKALEPVAAYYACVNAAPEALDKITSIMQKYEYLLRTPGITARQVYDGNRLFHFSIFEASNMDRLYNAIEKLWDSLAFFKLNYGRIYLEDENARSSALEDHRKYHALLQRRDARGLFDALNANLERLVLNMPKFFSEE